VLRVVPRGLSWRLLPPLSLLSRRSAKRDRRELANSVELWESHDCAGDTERGARWAQEA
jgi:hypothetical protein